MPKIMFAVGAALLLVLLSGCDEPSPYESAVPTATATPVFASDEEALAAAEVAYGEYLTVSDAIFADGGNDTDRLTGVATGAFLETEVAGFNNVKANGWHSVGMSTFDSVELQYHESGTAPEVVVYLCDDVSGVDVLDSAGASVVSPDRPARTEFQVTLNFSPTAQKLLISGHEVWSDEGC